MNADQARRLARACREKADACRKMAETWEQRANEYDDEARRAAPPARRARRGRWRAPSPAERAIYDALPADEWISCQQLADEIRDGNYGRVYPHLVVLENLGMAERRPGPTTQVWRAIRVDEDVWAAITDELVELEEVEKRLRPFYD